MIGLIQYVFRHGEVVLQVRATTYSQWVDVPKEKEQSVLCPEKAVVEAPTARECKRSACKTKESDTWWWNQSTLAWYCRNCARKINDATTGGTPYLCIPDYNLPTKADLQ